MLGDQLPGGLLLSYAGHDLSPYVYVYDFTRSAGISRNIEQTEIPGMDGSLANVTGLSSVEVTISCHLYAKGIDEAERARRALAGILMSSSEPQKLVVGDPSTYLLGIYTGGAELSSVYTMPDMELTFLCPDPVAYGQERSASLTTSQKLVDAGGTYKAWPTVTATPASGSYWTLFNVSTGDFVRVEASFTGSQTVVLDMAKQRCTINGTDHAVTIASDFFSINGQQKFKISSGMATMEWSERWL